MRTEAVAVALGLTVLLALPAGADQVIVRDRQDTESSFLDLSSASVAHVQRADGSWRLRHTIRTHQSWRSRRLCRDSFLTVLIKETGRSFQIYWRHGLKARVRDGDTNRVLAHVAVWRPDRRAVRIAVRPRFLGQVGVSYEWRAQSLAGSCGCDDVATCEASLDRAPNKGYARHEL